MEDKQHIDTDTRNKLALALDVDDLVVGVRVARELQPYFGVIKIGLELYSAAGPEILGTLQQLGYKIFLDLKLHDIPNTVNSAAKVLGSLGVDYLTLHTAGGAEMATAGVEGLLEGARNAGLADPIALGVTILTSDQDSSDTLMKERLKVAVDSGCRGLVCSARDLPYARNHAPALLRVVPGIRPLGVEAHDQKKIATPLEAIKSGADLLVIGRAVTQADDPVMASREIHAELTQV